MMIKIVVVVPFFVPSTYHFVRTSNCFDSLKDLDVEKIFVGYSEEKYKLVLQEYAKHAKCIFQEENLGKAFNVNQVTKDLDFDYMLSLDGDIEYLGQPDFFDRMLKASQELEKIQNKPLGFLGLNFKGENVHLFDKLNNKHTYKFRELEETILYSDKPEGIGGGALFTSKKAWKRIGGYRQFGLYGGNDGFYLSDCHNQGFSYGMFESLSVHHPFDDDKPYRDWKKQQVLSIDGVHRSEQQLREIKKANLWQKD